MFMVWNASEGYCVGMYQDYNDAKEDIAADGGSYDDCYEVYKIEKIGEFCPTISVTFCAD